MMTHTRWAFVGALASIAGPLGTFAGPSTSAATRPAAQASSGDVQTHFEAGEFTALFDNLSQTVRKDRDRSPRMRQGKPIHTNPHWVRDHIHEMKAYKFWEQDLTSYVDALIELQHPDGFFYEILATRGHDADHFAFVGDMHRLAESDGLYWIRLELEADIEYLMVEAAYTIWQATGDDAAMKARLPHLEKGLQYDFTDPTRWDAEHGALKRTFTIDTWDFTYGVSDQNRRIEPGMPMGIMHGDNSGLYQACRQLACMYRHVGQAQKADEWEAKATGLRERINRLCWNGNFYTHQVLLTPVDTGVAEEKILSLSNTYDINRGLPTHEMAVRIIDEYARRREQHAVTHFAEWYSIDPPYPQFFRYKAGQYINGGITSFAAGELAKAAFNHGRESYGADILKRVAAKVAEDGQIYFLYTPQGKNQGGGPSGWGAASVISAMVEGLAGICDHGVLFREVTVSPRFVAAGIDHADVCTRYGPSGAYLTLKYDHMAESRSIRVRIDGAATKTHIRVLLPTEAREGRVVAPAGLGSHIEKVEKSFYVVTDWPEPLAQQPAELQIEYR